MLRAPKNAKKLSENDTLILRTVKTDFYTFTNAVDLLVNPRCTKHHEGAAQLISESIESVRQHLEECRALTADSEIIAEELSKHIAYVEELIATASDLIHEDTKEAETPVEDVEKQEETVCSEEEVALRFGRLWEKGGHRRVYFDEKAVAKAVGFELRSVRGTKRYFLEDDEYTNSAMAKLFQAFDGTYYDLNKKAFVSTSSKNDLLDSFKAIFAREVEVLHAVEQPEVEEENEGVDVSPEDTRYYDPALHINAHEVKALFRELCPHGKDSARLSIVDVTPGHADGEKYVICITHLGPDPHCPDVLSRVCGEPLASSRMVWTSKEIASKYAIVFDRDAVEGLIKTWKENDPVRDSRAEETARKERAKVRREAQGE